METIPIYLKSHMDEISLFEKVADHASLTKEERRRYENSLQLYRDEMAVKSFYTTKGHEEGFEQGREEGREEVAVNMLKAGLPIELIASMTQLSNQTINALKDRL